MDTASQSAKPATPAQSYRFLARAWYSLCGPRVTGLAALILAGVVGLLLVVPQQPLAGSGTPGAGRDVWIAGLPPLVQLWGEPLYFLGFAALLQSLWFWLPLAVLLLNSLVSLADYGLGAWQRQRQTIPPITWQHPLAHRAGHSLRLPESPDTFLAALKAALRDQGFWIYEPVEPEQRLIGAARFRRAWLGPAGLYAGVLLLVAAGVISSQFLRTESFTLWPARAVDSRVLRGQFELADAGVVGGTGQVTYRREVDDQAAPARQFTWSLYQPVVLNGALIWPAGTGAVVTVEVHDSQGNLLRLIPVQENLAPAERLSLSLAGANTPLYFAVPAAGLAVQVTPGPDSIQPGYNVEVREGTRLVQASSVPAGEPFPLAGDLSATLTPGAALDVVVYQDPALLLYLLGAALVVAAGLLPLLRPPVQLWLIPEVKGRGGQLYAVLERFGPVEEGTLELVGLMEGGKDGRWRIEDGGWRIEDGG